MNKVLVTGGGGFLGKAIVKQLIARGDKVTSISRGSYPELQQMGVNCLQGDIADISCVEEACKGQDMVFHVAAKPGIWGDYQLYYNANVVGTQNVVDSCKKLGIRWLIYTSSPSVVFNGKDMEGVDESVPYPKEYHAHYPKTKAMAEQYVVKASDENLHTITLRPHLIWGPEDNHLVPRILARAKRLRRIGKENKLIDSVYIDSAAQAHILAADALKKNTELSGRVYFISQGEPVPLWDLVNGILEAGGKKKVMRTIPVSVAQFVGSGCEFFYKLFRIKSEPPMTRFLAEELSTAHWFDLSAAKNDFGYDPDISIEEGLKRLKAWLKS